MRFWILLLISSGLCAQQKFISLDHYTDLPLSVYDSIGKANTLLIGEIYGTNECPAIANAFVDLYLKKGKKVILALELPMQEQSYVEAFLKSNDSLVFKKSRFFNNTHDGRTGRAMVNLIRNQAGKKNVRVTSYVNAKTPTTPREQDSLMAVNILQLRAQYPDEIIVLLAGNLHIRTKQGFKPGMETMGYYLKKELGDAVLSVSVRFQRGQCFEKRNGKSQLYELAEDTSHYKFYLTGESYLLIDPGFEELGYQGIIYLREATPSLPYAGNTEAK